MSMRFMVSGAASGHKAAGRGELGPLQWGPRGAADAESGDLFHPDLSLWLPREPPCDPRSLKTHQYIDVYERKGITHAVIIVCVMHLPSGEN